MKNKEKAGLYVHVPFCKSKCAYCDFYSLAGGDCGDYFKYVLMQAKHISRICKDREFDTVFLGGGTPSLMPPDGFKSLFTGLRKYFNITKDAEISVEANPATLSENLLYTLREIGVNRLSIGLQSAVDTELKLLSRIHTKEDFISTFLLCRSAGFDNINIDLMYGIPAQTKESFLKSIEEVIALNPEHISMYGLKIEEGTPFSKVRDSLPLPSENDERDMYIEGIKTLELGGYRQYEISNLSKEGKECRHNLKYWLGCDYIGLGPAAHSFFCGKRFSVIADLSKYKEKASSDEIYENIETLDENDRITEFIMLRLRHREGISLSEFKDKFGFDFVTKFYPIIQRHKKFGLIEVTDKNVALTLEGMYVSNYIISDFLTKL